MRSRLTRLWRNLRHARAVDRELDAELQVFVEQVTDEQLRTGMSASDARRAALVELGSREAVKEHVRTVRAGALIDSMARDLRYAVRVLRRAPVFTLTAAASIAVGVGGTTAVFTVTNGLLFRAAPGIADPHSLVDIVGTPIGAPSGFMPMAPHHYEAIREQTSMLEGVYASGMEPKVLALKEAGGADRVFASAVTPNYFHVLRVPMATGRAFTEADVTGSARPTGLVLSHDFWTRKFESDPTVVGRTLQLGNHALPVLGVAAREFRGTNVVAPHVWMGGSAATITSGLIVGGRLAPDVSMTQATAEIQAIVDRSFSPNDPATIPSPQAGLDPGRRSPIRWSVVPSSPIPFALRGIAGAFLALLMVLVGVVLLIASANVAGVLLARATLRAREIAVRTALGAVRGRIMRQLLTETMVLFLIGGVGGLLFARLLTSALPRLLPAFAVPVHLSAPLDWRVLAFALALSLVAAIVAGLAPARHATKTNVVTALKDEMSSGPDARRLRQAFVICQVAFSTVLIVVAGLLFQRMGRISEVDYGFDSTDVVATSVDFAASGADPGAAAEFVDAILERARQLPGAQTVTAADRAPDASRRSVRISRMRAAGSPTVEASPTVIPNWHHVAPGYFETMKIPILRGREFTVHDREGTEPVVIVSAAAARQYWPGLDPIGRQFVLDDQMARFPAMGPSLPRSALTVVGVARDLKYPAGGEIAPTDIYVPFRQLPTAAVTILVRTSDETQTMTSLRTLVSALAPYEPPTRIEPLNRARSGPVETQLRIATSVAGGVGIIALLLAVTGIHGITAYVVAQRRREFGIRLALGAERRAVVGMALRHGMTPVVSGLVIGLALSVAAALLLASSSIGTVRLDPLVFVAVSLLFTAAGLVASYAPARWAGRINPMGLLKSE